MKLDEKKSVLVSLNDSAANDSVSNGQALAFESEIRGIVGEIKSKFPEAAMKLQKIADKIKDLT